MGLNLDFKFEKKHWLGIVLSLLLLTVSFIFFIGQRLFWFLVVVSFVAATVPFLLTFMASQNRQKEREEIFLAFTRDLVENVKSGTPIVKSIVNLQTRDYGALSPNIKKLANQLVMGITLQSALSTFAKDTKSRVIIRSVGLISEAERAGGKIDTILESVADSVNQIDTLKKERKSAISNLVTQGYLIFMIFIIIMLVLEFKILPLVTDLSGQEGGLSVNTSHLDAGQFAMPLFVMILVQSFFAGLVIGKISEGTIKAGIRHCFILLVLTLLITTGARALFG